MQFPTKPPFLRLNGDPINQGLTLWCVAPQSGTAGQLVGLDNTNSRFSTLYSGSAPVFAHSGVAPLASAASIGSDRFGGAFIGTTNANSYVDLGTNCAFLSDDTPSTIVWMVKFGASPGTYEGIFRLASVNLGQGFFAMHSSDTTNHYANFYCSRGNTSNNNSYFATAPSMSSLVGIWSTWMLTFPQGIGGLNSITAGSLYVDGVNYPRTSTSSSGSIGTSQINQFGSDGAGDQIKGSFDNLRIWNRVLTAQERAAVFADPFVGGRPRHREFIFNASRAGVGRYRWFLGA